MKGGASRATDRDAARTSTRMITIGERSVSFEDSENEDSRATDEVLAYGDDREESTTPTEAKAESRKEAVLSAGSRGVERPLSRNLADKLSAVVGRIRLTTTGVKKRKKLNRRRRLCAIQTDLLCVLQSMATPQRRTKFWRGVSKRCGEATGLGSSTLARRTKLLGAIYATSWLTQLAR
ncbi:hypothetical protein PC129_g16188 [Phytophthora cactorum]|uniref:Uncharacterized protein n=1 Tax=Phytophthora cactorum TaxID=29920 RepID=A0A329R9Y6_9STRA|nr:hypothetical protein Pcac1_g23212 [Phytophthora cactorum]KAG2794999.1 hypothetical protein PC111_g22340 [Phytophthora cactorum]KAG2795500.1 hypothetical protein PC112_g22616 [Phytophthora cactorum]KAG2864478.1 hypothetical protein PC113_g4526 [Phytophthora cactorum]KAG2880859.1 hypothetical protein PC115_g22390 [Phytophthora cactorum]